MLTKTPSAVSLDAARKLSKFEMVSTLLNRRRPVPGNP